MKMENTQKNREKPQRIAFEPTVFRGYLIRGDLNSSGWITRGTIPRKTGSVSSLPGIV